MVRQIIYPSPAGNDLHTALDIDDDLPTVDKELARGVFEPFPAQPGIVVTNEEVNVLRDAESI